MDFVAHKDGIKLVWKTSTTLIWLQIDRNSLILHILLDTITNIYRVHYGSIFLPHFRAHILRDLGEKKESSWNKPYLSRKKKFFEICGKGHFETRKAKLQWLSKIQKFMGQKQKEKWEKQVREKETPTFTISSARARALTRLFSFWPFDEHSCFLTAWEICSKFPFAV